MTHDLGETLSDRHLLITHRIRQRRADLGLTQKQVVSRLGRVGLRTTNRALSSLEHGAGVDVAKLPELAAALECTVTYLVGLTAHPHRWEPDPVPMQPARRPAEPRLGPPPVRESLIITSAVPDRGPRLWPDGTLES